MKNGIATIVIGLAAALGVTTTGALAASEAEMVARGQYLVTIGNCTDCHTDGFLLGAPNPDLYLAGADNGIFIPGLGVMYPPNLTPDMETGLGSWSAADIVRALKEGVRPDGSALRPPMPVVNTSVLTDEDAMAVATFLKSMAPVSHATQANPVPPEEAGGPYMIFVFPGQE
jgi:mono/diheme cytochrome c family protein